MNVPQPSCEFSQLTIPSDSRYAGVAARYAAEVAQLIGFDARVQDQIYHGIQAALPALMRYSFESQERGALDVSCERIPVGLKIVVEYKGLGTEPSSRGSVLVQFKYLDKPAATEVYAPPQHAEILRAI